MALRPWDKGRSRAALLARALLTGLLLGSLLPLAFAQGRKLYPVDEGPEDRSFLLFR